MRLVGIRSIREGMELARDIPGANATSVPLLRRGVNLSGRLGRLLEESGVRAVWIQDGMGEGIEPTASIPDNVRRSAEAASAACLAGAQRSLAGNGMLSSEMIDMMQAAAAGITAALLDCPEAACALDDLVSTDSYTHTHSVRAATVGLMVASRMMRKHGWTDWDGKQRFDRITDRLITFGTGVLIHDIGKVVVPSDILNKPGKLTAAEMEVVKEHPGAGAAMLSPRSISPLAIAIVRDHHERWDGNGYPAGKAGEDVHWFARMAAVADTYDAVIGARPYRDAADPHVGVRVILEGAGSQFDPNVVECFRAIVMPYPVGFTLMLPDGKEGVVCAVDQTRPEHPIVRYRDSRGNLNENVMNIVSGHVIDGYEPTSDTPRPLLRRDTAQHPAPTPRLQPVYTPA